MRRIITYGDQLYVVSTANKVRMNAARLSIMKILILILQRASNPVNTAKHIGECTTALNDNDNDLTHAGQPSVV